MLKHFLVIKITMSQQYTLSWLGHVILLLLCQRVAPFTIEDGSRLIPVTAARLVLLAA